MLPLMLVAIGYTLPFNSNAESEIIIQAAPRIIYQLINKPAQHLLWAPWVYDPEQTIRHESTRILQGKGATFSWLDSGGAVNSGGSVNNGAVANGSTTITSSIPYKFITGDLVFNKLPTASYKFTIYNNKANTQARVLFQYQSLEQGPINRLITAMFGNRRQSELDASLVRLKSIAEAESENLLITVY